MCVCVSMQQFCVDDDENDVFIGPVTDAELAAKQQQRRRTLIELPTPVGKRVLSMSVKSFVVVPMDDEAEPETPAKVFEFLKSRANENLNPFQIRYKNQVMRELIEEAKMKDDSFSEWRRPAVPSFVRIPKEANVEVVEANEAFIYATEDSRSMEPASASLGFAAPPLMIPTPEKSRASFCHFTAGKCSSAPAGSSKERKFRLNSILADREGIKSGGTCCIQPDSNAWKLALPWLTEEEKNKLNQYLAA